jgi:hypothetical protein
VDGERFGLIVANPPFVISPEQRFEYRDSELRGDEISRQVVRGAADHLEPGGFACVLCNWAMGPGEEWSAPLRRWLDGTPVDAWLMHKDIQDTLAYADTWLVGPTGEEYDRALGEWMEYYRELGIEAVGTGTVILRGRAAGPGWIREAHVPATKSPEATKHILRVFHNHDFLQSLTGVADLLAGAYRVTPDLRVEQVMSWRDGAYEVERSDLSFENGLALTGPTDTDFLRILVACDGARTLSDIIREVAPALGMEPAVVEPAAAEVVRGMLSLGFLEAPASGSA